MLISSILPQSFLNLHIMAVYKIIRAQQAQASIYKSIIIIYYNTIPKTIKYCTLFTQIEMDNRQLRKQQSDQQLPHTFSQSLQSRAQQTVLNKILILQSNCHEAQQLSVSIPYNSTTRRLDLGQTLYQILRQIVPVGHTYQVFYYCSQSQYFIFGGMYPFQDYLFLSQDFAGLPYISVKILRIYPPITTQTQVTINKKKRVNDRTIQKVLQKVAEWRSISQNKNITLEQSAKQIDLPKKTLDDYFYQIKQGEYYGFDFQMNQNQKIGVLRRFVKQKHTKKPEQTIKILEQFMGNNQQREEDQDLSGSQQEQ